MTRDNNIPEIDFVITWVDGNDPDWQKQKMEYSMQPDLSQKQDDRKEIQRLGSAEVLVSWCGAFCTMGAQDTLCYMGASAILVK